LSLYTEEGNESSEETGTPLIEMMLEKDIIAR